MRPTLRAVAFWASVGAMAPVGSTVAAAVGARAEPDSASTNTARVARIEAVIHPAVRREGLGIIHDARRFGKALHFGVRLERAVQLSKCIEPSGRSNLFYQVTHASSNHIARNRDGLDGVARHRLARHLDSHPVPPARCGTLRTGARSAPAVYSHIHRAGCYQRIQLLWRPAFAYVAPGRPRSVAAPARSYHMGVLADLKGA